MLCRFGHPELSWQDVQVALAPAAHEYCLAPRSSSNFHSNYVTRRRIFSALGVTPLFGQYITRAWDTPYVDATS